ncbi:MAG: hypothetical protein ABI134_08745, partial [Byssovorax sp.]
RFRKNDKGASAYPYSSSSDSRFHVEDTPRGPVVTSSAQNDAGLFELNLRDERYLPFEGAGVIGTWVVKLPKDTNGFDISTLDDLILHVRYTARVATQADFLALDKPKLTKTRIFSARAEFPNQWAQLMNPLPSQDQTLTFALDRSLFPYVVPTKKIILSKVTIYARWNGAVDFSATSPLELKIFKPGVPPPDPVEKELTVLTGGHNLVATEQIVLAGVERELGDWRIEISSDEVGKLVEQLRTSSNPTRLDGTLQDIWLVCDYGTSSL